MTVPPVDPNRIQWPADVLRIAHPLDVKGWTDQLDVMVATPAGERDNILEALYRWAAQRALEESMLDDLSTLLETRPRDAPGLLIVHTPDGPEEVIVMESAWIPSSTVIWAAPDQPDLMVRRDHSGVIARYRQVRGWSANLDTPNG